MVGETQNYVHLLNHCAVDADTIVTLTIWQSLEHRANKSSGLAVSMRVLFINSCVRFSRATLNTVQSISCAHNQYC